MLRVFSIILILLVLPLFTAFIKAASAGAKSGELLAQNSQKNPATQQQSTQAVPGKTTQTMNGITRIAANAGVRTCLDRIEKTGNFVTENSKSRAVMFLPSADANRQVTSVSYEIQTQNNTLAYGSMTAAPTIDGGCDALYETVVYWANKCTDVADKVFPGLKRLGVVQEHITVLEVGEDANIFLMPVANAAGCVSIKKQVIY